MSRKPDSHLDFLLPADRSGIDPQLLDDFVNLEKLADYAKGIPDKNRYGDVGKLNPGELVDFVLQHHLAERAGPHYDVRFGTPQTGLYSWATRKGLPEPGQRVALFQTPLHSYDYGSFEGEIEEGYGKGKVEMADKGSVLITKATPKSVHFTIAHKKHPERFVLFRPGKWGEGNWLLINTTPTESIGYPKVRYKKIPSSEIDKYIKQMKEGDTLEAKIDGASSLIKILDKGIEVASYRTSKETGRPIVHSEKFFPEGWHEKMPKDLVGTVLRGEVYGKRKEDHEEVLSPHELSGLLGSRLEKALQQEREKNIDLKAMIYDIAQRGQTPVDWNEVPRLERRQMIEDVLKRIPTDKFQLSGAATTPQEAERLWQEIVSGQHPLTTEGAVYWPAYGDPVKAKLLEDYDVHIRNILPGHGKYEGTGAGGFEYSLEPEGPIVGRVGTGFSDEDRRWMLQTPEDWVGRVARVQAQQQLPSGALRAPSFQAFHEDYPAMQSPVQPGEKQGAKGLPAMPREEAHTKAQQGLQQLQPQIEYGEVVGRLPRWEGTPRQHPTTHDIDLLVVPKPDQKPQLDQPYNVFFAKPEHFEPSLIHWLSGKAIIHLKGAARDRGWSLNRYGLQKPGQPRVTDAYQIYQELGQEMPAHIQQAIERWRQSMGAQKQAVAPPGTGGQVPMTGPSSAEFAVIGDAPGRIELQQGVPLSGPSGKFLDDILRQEGIDPSKILKGNIYETAETQEPDRTHELGRKRLQELARYPELAAILGISDIAGQGLTGEKSRPMYEWREQEYETDTGQPIQITYHPAALLRTGRHKSKYYGKLVEDLRRLIDKSKSEKANYTTTRTATRNGDVYDINMLIERVSGRPAVNVPLPSISRSRRDGFSRDRYERTNLEIPIIVDREGRLWDGRHRVARLEDLGRTQAKAFVANPEDLDAVKNVGLKADEVGR